MDFQSIVFQLAWSYSVTSDTKTSNAQALGIDNVVITATGASGIPSPALTAADNATVDNAFDVTFTDDATWRGKITSIEVGGTALDVLAYSVTAGKITFTPSVDALLQIAGTKSIVVKATGYADAFVSQDIAAGAADKLVITTQPAAPAVNGTALATQPVVEIQDQYGNKTASTADVVAAVGAGAWTLGGTTTKAASNGTATFTDLTATSSAAVNNAFITFTCIGLTVNSNTFNLPAPAVKPTNHATNFTATPIYNTIKLDWTDAADAAGYLIKGSAVGYADITAPTDGTAEDDGELVKNIAAGVQTYTFTDLSETTDYFFKIYPYNGAGTNIKYKTDGAVPEATATTGALPTTLLVEDFDYANGALLTANGWTAHSGPGSQSIDVTVPGLTFDDYIGSDAGTSGAARLDNNGEDVNKKFTPQTEGAVYAAFIMSAGSSNSAGYFFHFANDVVATNTFISRVWVNGTGTGVGIGASTPAEYITITANTPTLIVVKYDFATSISSLYVLNSISLTEPATPDATYNETKPANVGSVALRQYNANQNIIVDGIRVTTRWEDLIKDLSIFNGTGNWSTDANWYSGVAAKSTDNVIVKGAATLDGNVTVNNLTIASGATLLTDTYTLTITSGTATVEQLVNKPQTYYIGSPVGGTVTTTNIGDAIEFTESSDTWAATATPFTTVGKGYGVQVGKNESPGTTTISFTGTELNSGNKNVTLTIGDRKFNFLGNPYPSYLDGAEVVASANLEKTIWMYHKTGVDGGGKSVYQFKFYNVSGAGTGTLSDKYIPTMQGFWVRVAPEVTSNFTYTFINGMRTHKGTSTTVFLAPQVSEKQELRLALSNGTVSDEAILLFSENANNDWNSSKMMNPGLNIYTVKGSESLALNSRTAIEYDVETAVGVKAESGVYTFSASKFENFGAEKAYLLDKVANVATDLSSGDYTVNFAEAYDGTDRFALVFPRSGVVTGLENAEAAGFFAFANNNRICVNSDAQAGMIYVFNSVGQQVAAEAISGKLTTVSTALPAGVYMVKVNNLTTKVIVR